MTRAKRRIIGPFVGVVLALVPCTYAAAQGQSSDIGTAYLLCVAAAYGELPDIAEKKLRYGASAAACHQLRERLRAALKHTFGRNEGTPLLIHMDITLRDKLMAF